MVADIILLLDLSVQKIRIHKLSTNIIRPGRAGSWGSAFGPQWWPSSREAGTRALTSTAAPLDTRAPQPWLSQCITRWA